MAERGALAPAATGPALDVHVATSTSELDALERPWTALHAATGASVFQSFPWQRAWWRHLGEGARGRELHVVVVRSGERVVAIAPLFVETVRAFGLVRLRRLAFLGTGLTDYLDVLVEKGLAQACLERIAAHLALGQAGWDVISLCDIPDASPARDGLLPALERHGLQGTRFVGEYCPRTRLGGSWKETLESFEGNHRRQLAKRTRQLKEHFAVELEVCGGDEDVGPHVDQFIAMHQHRWNAVGRKGVFADPRAAAFQREVARAFAARGWLFLAFLRVDGVRLAALCGFAHRGELAYYLNGMADAGAAGRYSPGLVLHALCMEALIARGVRVYDFLRGTERYKYELGAVDVPNWAFLAFRGAARLSRLKNAAVLLDESLRRRVEAERLAFSHQRRLHGLLSRGMARHLASRVRATVLDGFRKLRAPEKSLTVDA